MKTLRATLVPLAAFALIWLAMPGASFVPKGYLSTPQARAAHQQRWGEPWTSLNVSAGILQRIREPIIAPIRGIQPVFRVAQSWHLYRDGPRPIRRMEVWVDTALVYRTGDPEYDWREGVFRNRRIRPMAESLVVRKKARNRLGIGRLIVQLATQDFPDASRVEIRSVWARRGKTPAVHHSMTATGPDWALEDSP